MPPKSWAQIMLDVARGVNRENKLVEFDPNRNCPERGIEADRSTAGLFGRSQTGIRNAFGGRSRQTAGATKPRRKFRENAHILREKRVAVSMCAEPNINVAGCSRCISFRGTGQRFSDTVSKLRGTSLQRDRSHSASVTTLSTNEKTQIAAYLCFRVNRDVQFRAAAVKSCGLP